MHRMPTLRVAEDGSGCGAWSCRSGPVLSRRRLLELSGFGLGTISLALLMQEEGLLAHEGENRPLDLRPRSGHFPARANAVVMFVQNGGPSQMELFDPKPELNRLDGKRHSIKVEMFQLGSERNVLLGTPFRFLPCGECGMELSDLLPHLATVADDIALVRSMHTDAFNHHPGQLIMNTGVPMFGRPSIGAWLTYGLGSESENLPGYVVLTAGRGTSGGATLWTSGFLPTSFQGVLFRNQGEPVLNLYNPPGLSPEMQRASLDAIQQLNARRQRLLGDPQIEARMASYELAFRMQSAAPELIDLSDETEATLEAYGVNRPDDPDHGYRGGGQGVFRTFATNCLLARRLVERGVRFVNLYHASWDHHSNLNPELAFNCRLADQPVAALVKDLKARGLLESTLVVFASEFGRTPLGENRGGREANTGRDHHPYAFSIWLAGGGVRGGQVIGKTDEIGWGVVEDPVHVNDLHATLLHLFGLDHLRLTYRFQGRDFRLTDVGGKIVHKLLA